MEEHVETYNKLVVSEDIKEAYRQNRGDYVCQELLKDLERRELALKMVKTGCQKHSVLIRRCKNLEKEWTGDMIKIVEEKWEMKTKFRHTWSKCEVT
jgi:hypothetical protein